jgi:hypothetical protein
MCYSALALKVDVSIVYQSRAGDTIFKPEAHMRNIRLVMVRGESEIGSRLWAHFEVKKYQFWGTIYLTSHKN